MIGYEGAPRYASAIRALTGDTEIVPPGLTLESDRPEYSYLKRETLWGVRIILAAGGAGNFGQGFLFAASARHILMVDAVYSSANGVEVGLVVNPAVAGFTQSFATVRDARSARTTLVAPVSLFSRNNAGALGGVSYLYRVLTNSWANVPIICDAGTQVAVYFNGITNNSALELTIQGRTRLGLPEELADV